MDCDCIEILKRLVAFDTVNPPGNERTAAMYLAELLTAYGFICELQEVGDNRANLIAEMRAAGTQEKAPVLLYNGHLDVVPAAGEWQTDPFELVRKGTRLYGRGTSDMKGGIAAMCEAAIRIARRGGPKKGCLKLVFVADEECSNLGIMRYLEEMQNAVGARLPRPQGRSGSRAGVDGDGGSGVDLAGAQDVYVVIGEPTELQAAIAHRGVSRDYIDIQGTARHAALSGRQPGSIEQAADVILAFKAMNEQLQTIRHEVLPSPSIAITKLQAYEKDNIVPAKVRLLLDFRILPGMDRQSADDILERGLAEAGVYNYKKIPHFYMPGGEISSKDDFVKQCLKVCDEVAGQGGQACAFEASCEQCFFIGSGAKAVICGPGNIAQAHAIDEYIEEGQVRQAVRLYEHLVEQILGVDDRS